MAGPLIYPTGLWCFSGECGPGVDQGEEGEDEVGWDEDGEVSVGGAVGTQAPLMLMRFAAMVR